MYSCSRPSSKRCLAATSLVPADISWRDAISSRPPSCFLSFPAPAAPVSAPRRQRPPADVTAAEAARPVDTVDGGIGTGLRLGHVAAERRDVQYAPAGGDQPAVAPGRT